MSHSGNKWILCESAAVSERFSDKSLLKWHLSNLSNSHCVLKMQNFNLNTLMDQVERW